MRIGCGFVPNVRIVAPKIFRKDFDYVGTYLLASLIVVGTGTAAGGGRRPEENIPYS
jgi:hypothetical protein